MEGLETLVAPTAAWKRTEDSCYVGYGYSEKIIGYWRRCIKTHLVQWELTVRFRIGLVPSSVSCKVVYFLHCFLSRVSTPTRDIDIALLSVSPSVCPPVRDVLVSDENGLTYRHSFFSPYGSPIILVLLASNIFTKFRRGHPPAGALNTGGV